MKAKCIFPLLAIGLAVMALTSCSIHVNKRSDNTEVKTKTFEAKDFNKISISCSADIEYTVSDTVSITVKATDDWIKTLDISTAADGTLVISKKDEDDGVFHINIHYGECKVIISGPSLEGVTIDGSGSFKCDDEMQVKTFTSSISGSGDIVIKSIKSENAAFSIEGSGDIMASNIETSKLNVAISGSGDIVINAVSVADISASIEGSGDIALDCKDCDTATVSTLGSGDIKISGNLKHLNQSTEGSGDIDISKLNIGE